MEIVQATWEKRNLGINCIEIMVGDADPIEALKKSLRENSADYMVVKMPIQRMDLYRIVTGSGYCFVETLFEMEKKIALPILHSDQKEKARYLSYRLDQLESKERVFSAIRDHMFTTDRISLDDHFTLDQAAERYIGMLTDELDRGGELMEYYFKSEPMGFACFRRLNNEVFYQSLTGLYAKYRGRGFGFLPSYLSIKEMMKRNGQIVKTAVSSNNIISLRAHIHGGFYPISIKNIFVKHN